MANTYTRLLVHFVFTTKRRECSLMAGIWPWLFQYLGGLERKGNGFPD